MHCTNCGVKLNDGAKFCTECGTPVKGGGEVVAAPDAATVTPLEYEMVGSTVPAVEITLDAGRSVYSQSGGMAWQTEGITMTTNTRGGVLKGLGRMLAGESLFMANFTSSRDGAKVAFAAAVPGAIVPVDLTGTPGIIAQKKAFLCADTTVDVSIALTKKLSSGLFGGEGFILEDIKGTGTVFLEVDGDKVERELAPGEVLKVDTGNVVAFDKTVTYEIETVSGLTNIFFGGEGLFLTKLTGPGKVILQTQNFNDFAQRVIALMPTKTN